jgi:hypothetical protein
MAPDDGAEVGRCVSYDQSMSKFEDAARPVARGLCVVAGCAACACPPPEDRAQPAPPSEIAPADPGEIRTAEDLLRAVERSDAGLTTLSADVMYDRLFEIQGDRQIRWGRVFLENRPARADGTPDRRAGVRFTRLQVGDRAFDDTYEVVYDGESVVERWVDKKVFIKTRLGREGGDEPLRVGRGPIPLPFGQRASDILTRYDATLVSSGEGAEGNDEVQSEGLKRFVEGTVQLKLTIRRELASKEDLHEIRLWYKRDEQGRFIPRLARAVNRSGDVSLVQIINVKLNEALPEGVLETGTPGEGWDVQIRDGSR